MFRRFLVFLCLVSGLSSVASFSYGQDTPLGAVFVSKNIIESQNSGFWFYWNHHAIYVGDTDGDGIGEVVEAQSGPYYGYGVIKTPVTEYLNRPYRIVVFYPRKLETGIKAAEIAKTFIGRPYRPYSSVVPRAIPKVVPSLLHGTPDGMNCVSVTRDSYEGATGRVLIGYQNPDSIFAFMWLFSGPYYIK